MENIQQYARTFDQLSEAQQDKAKNDALTNLLSMIIEQAMIFDDETNGDDFQARVDAAANEAERLQTPWFTAEIIMEDEVCKTKLLAMALDAATDAIYVTDDCPGIIRLQKEN